MKAQMLFQIGFTKNLSYVTYVAYLTDFTTVNARMINLRVWCSILDCT